MYTKEELKFIKENRYIIKKFIEEFKITKNKWINKFAELNPEINEYKLEEYFDEEFNDFITKNGKYYKDKDFKLRPFADIFDLYCDKIDYGYPDPEDLGKTR